ncbi:hypothetical protein GS416_05555 [Rhodococcus hoagii]|nr:hypothetical protein [Prescottella equi]
MPTTVAGTAIVVRCRCRCAGCPGGGRRRSRWCRCCWRSRWAGDTLAEPREIDLPNLPRARCRCHHHPVSDQLAGQPPQVAQAVQDAVDAAPQVAAAVNDQAVIARDAVLGQPGGDQ